MHYIHHVVISLTSSVFVNRTNAKICELSAKQTKFLLISSNLNTNLFDPFIFSYPSGFQQMKNLKWSGFLENL